MLGLALPDSHVPAIGWLARPVMAPRLADPGSGPLRSLCIVCISQVSSWVSAGEHQVMSFTLRLVVL